MLMPEKKKQQKILGKAAELISEFYAGIDDRAVKPTLALDEIRERIDALRLEKAGDADEVLTEVAALLSNGNLQCVHPRYFGLFNPTPAFSGAVGDLLVSSFNPQIGVHHHAPASVEMEEYLLRFVGDLFGLEKERVAGSFTNGGTEANHNAVLLALSKAFPKYRQEGTRGLDGQPVFYVSHEAHHSFVRIAHVCGLGSNAVRYVPVLEDLRMNLEALEAQIAEDRAAGLQPFLLVATAGHTSSGIIDQLEECADICDRHGLHYHVDAAWGGAAVFSDTLRPHMKGIEKADSITFDAHKWAMPIATGIFLCTDKAALRNTFEISTQYVPAGAEGLTHYHLQGLQWSRRSIGMRLFLTLAIDGLEGYAAAIDHQTEMGNILKRRLSEEGWTQHNDTPLPIVCFTSEKIDGSDDASIEELNERYKRFAGEIVERGNCWISVTQLRGRPVLRACITSYLVQPDHIEALMEELRLGLGQ